MLYLKLEQMKVINHYLLFQAIIVSSRIVSMYNGKGGVALFILHDLSLAELTDLGMVENAERSGCAERIKLLV